ncbi:MAG: TrbI/VirB10 family protein [Acidobacteria bacterium]|nr:TrbI/VirB10 family protein [Acidobacteriota bacterium]
MEGSLSIKKVSALLIVVFLLSPFSLCAKAQDRDEDGWEVPIGTKIPLVLMNSVSSRNARIGDQVYLQTIFPITAGRRIAIPRGSDMRGTIVGLKQPGRISGRGEMVIRFDQIILPNGVSKEISGVLTGTDGRSRQRMEDGDGRISGESSAGQDAAVISQSAGTGAIIGAIAGRGGQDAAIGAGAGAAAALVAVLLTRGPGVNLSRGTTLQMQLTRPVTFEGPEIEFTEAEMNRKPLQEVPESLDAYRQRRRPPRVYPFPYRPAGWFYWRHWR